MHRSGSKGLGAPLAYMEWIIRVSTRISGGLGLNRVVLGGRPVMCMRQ